MLKLSAEAKVGIFVVIGIIILALMAMQVGKLGLRFGEGYTVHAFFDTASGLAPDTPVEIAGVEVGRVNKIRLSKGKALVTINIYPGVKITESVKAIIRTRGILGDKYIELLRGVEGAALIQAGGRIFHTEPTTDIDTLMTVLGEVANDIRILSHTFASVIGGEKGEASLRSILDNLDETIQSINRTVQGNDENVKEITSNLSAFSQRIREIGDTNLDDLQIIFKNVRRATGKIEKLMVGINQITDRINRGEGSIGKLVQEDETVENLNKAMASLREITDKISKGEGTLGRLLTEDQTVNQLDQTLSSMQEITEKINRGEGSLGRLINDDETVESLNSTLSSINDLLKKQDMFRTYLDYRGEYLFESNRVKSYFTLRIQPREDKYYMLQIVDNPRGKETVTKTIRTVDGVTSTEKKVESESSDLLFSAQIAKRYYDIGFRAGLFESTGGAGIDYYLFKDRLKLSFEAFDFDIETRPHLTFKADYKPFEFLYLTTGVDDLISDIGRESYFVGGGFSFSDEDIKTLLRSVTFTARTD